MAPRSDPRDERVLVFAPTGRDAELACDALAAAGFQTQACSTLADLYRESEAGIGVALLTAEEALAESSLQEMRSVLDRQPPWSDLPLIVLTTNGFTTQAVLEVLSSSGTLMTLERPVPMSTLVSAVRSALGARRRQYEVRDLLEQLEMASRQKDEFLAMLAHELRNPLAPLSNAVQLLRMRGATDPTTLRVREVVERQVQHICRLVDDLLDVSRLTRGKITLRRARLDLGYLIQATLEDHRESIDAAGLTLTVELPEEPVWIEGDSTRLAQVLANLIQNALKFTEAGGQVTVACRVSGGEGRGEAGMAPTPSAMVSVRDTGIGISPEMLPRVFEPFAQDEQSLDRSRGGLGLGLALVKKLVELHGGEVGVHSEGPGHGAEFFLRLPLANGPEPSPRHRPVSDEPAPKQRVLLVEDNRDAADTLRDLLTLAGHEVRVAYSGPEGIEAARQFRPEVVLCDLGLPEMDGYQVAAAMRQDPATASAHLIAVTGYGKPEDRRRSHEAGFDAHLTKPVNTHELQRLLTSRSRGSG